jgi:hypothetical protein
MREKKFPIWQILFGALTFFVLVGGAASLFFPSSPSPSSAFGKDVSRPTPTPFRPSTVLPFTESWHSSHHPSSQPQYEGGVNPYETPQVFPTLSVITPFSLPEGYNPLTGEPPASPDLLNRRPMAIKVTNFPRYVRPQSGLTLADVVFEYYIEAGLSRFIAIFYGNDSDAVGPVRSGRYFDAHVARMYHAYLVFKYADPRVYSYLKGSDLKDFLIVPGNAVGAIYSGPNLQDSYNNYFFNTRKFQTYLAEHGKDNSRQDIESGYFSTLAPTLYPSVKRIYTFYSVDDYHYWEYDAFRDTYLRYQETDDTRGGKPESYAPLVDAVTMQQVNADNIVVLFVPYTFANKYDEEDEVYHIDLLNAGNAYLFRDGVGIQAIWRRIRTDQPLLLTDMKGMPLSLKPGRTFYEVIGIHSTSWTDGEEGMYWHFRFQTP